MKYGLHEDPLKDYRYSEETDSPCINCRNAIDLFKHLCSAYPGKIPMKYWNNRKNCPRRVIRSSTDTILEESTCNDNGDSPCMNCRNFRSAAAHTCGVYPKGIPSEYWNGKISCTKNQPEPSPGNYGTLDDRYWFDACKTLCKRCSHIQSFSGHKCTVFPEEIPPVYWNCEIMCPKYKENDQA